MGQKDFGVEFPKHGKSSSQGKARPTGPFPESGKPKSKVNGGEKYPTTTKPGGESKYSDKK